MEWKVGLCVNTWPFDVCISDTESRKLDGKSYHVITTVERLILTELSYFVQTSLLMQKKFNIGVGMNWNYNLLCCGMS